MTKTIPKELREKVIREYLKGKYGNEIAKYLGLGKGTVSNIILEWKSKLDAYEPESIRELALEMRRAGITPRDCVERLRLINKMKEFEMNEDDFAELIEGIQAKAIQKGVPAEKCGESVSQLFKIAERESVSPEEVPNYVMQKLSEKVKVETEISSLNEQILNLKTQQEELLRRNNVIAENISLYESLKDQLEKHNIPVTQISYTFNVIKNLGTQEKETERILKIASDTLSLEDQLRAIQDQYMLYKNGLSQYQEIFPVLKTVQDSGVAVNELRTFVNTVSFMAQRDRLSINAAANILMWKINQEHIVVDYEKEIQSKRLVMESLTDKIEELHEEWAADLSSIQTLIRLARRGVTGENILAFDNFFRTNQAKISLSSFEADLGKYRTMIKLLNELEIKVVKKIQQYRAFNTELNSLKQAAADLARKQASAISNADSVIENAKRVQSKLPPLEAKLNLLDEKEKNTCTHTEVATTDKECGTSINDKSSLRPTVRQEGQD
jgi:hypothetical protein